MAPNENKNESIEKARDAIARGSRLHWFHWLIISASLLLTLTAWYFSKSQVEEKIRNQFTREADQVAELISDRMIKYEDALRSGVAAIQSHGGDISNRDWHQFAKSLQIETEYPGINGIGVIHYVPPDRLDAYLQEQRADRPDYGLHPSHNQGEFWPITYIEPVETNIQAVGLDMAHETNRYTAAKNARDTGQTQITGPIVLVQDAKKTPGFLFYTPFYKGGVYEAIEERRQNFTGMVYAPFVVSRLMAGTLEKDKRHVGVRITDGDKVIYDEHVDAFTDFDANPMFKKNYVVELYGRTWGFDIWSDHSFRGAVSNTQPLIIIIGGVAIDSLVFLLFITISRSNRMAIRFADRMTEEVRTRSDDLERLNSDLEQRNKDLDDFAYVASHDLKAPLRAINNLAKWVFDDAYELLPQESKEHLDQMQNRVNRLDSLLSELLAYSRVGRVLAEPQTIDTGKMLREIVDLLNPPDGMTVDIVGDLPTLTTPKAAIEQVFRNLINNAIKHHDKPDGHIVVSADNGTGPLVEFTVSDDGPGIPDKFHKKIFEIFKTLKRRDEVEGSGMGLAVVKKVVDGFGGKVWVESSGGRGTTFHFTWPKQTIKAAQYHTKRSISCW